MKIGIDLDDTLSQTMEVLMKFHNDTYGTNLEMKDVTTSDLWKVWNGTLAEAVKKIHDFHISSYGSNLLPLNGAKEILERLKKNNELYIITARNDDIRKDTEEWVEKNFPGIFTKVYFTNHFLQNSTSTTKKKICDDLGIDIFIDDNLPNILDCSESNRKTYLIDYPWNQTDKLPEGAKRVYSWKEIGEFLQK